jgi:hypothetical protein
MQRLILTFPTLHKVLAAEKALKTAKEGYLCRVTPTPAGLGYSICGMAIEVLDTEKQDQIVGFLARLDLSPSGIHYA